MSKKIEPVNHDEWVKELLGGQICNKPEGSYTIEELMKLTGLKRASTQRAVQEKVDSGDFKKIKCRIETGRVQSVYVPIHNKKK